MKKTLLIFTTAFAFIGFTFLLIAFFYTTFNFTCWTDAGRWAFSLISFLVISTAFVVSFLEKEI